MVTRTIYVCIINWSYEDWTCNAKWVQCFIQRVGFPTPSSAFPPQALLTLLYTLYYFPTPCKWDQVLHLLVLKVIILYETLGCMGQPYLYIIIYFVLMPNVCVHRDVRWGRFQICAAHWPLDNRYLNKLHLSPYIQ